MIKVIKNYFRKEVFRTITDPDGVVCVDLDKNAPLPRIGEKVFFGLASHGDQQGLVSDILHHYNKDGTLFMITIRTDKS